VRKRAQRTVAVLVVVAVPGVAMLLNAATQRQRLTPQVVFTRIPAAAALDTLPWEYPPGSAVAAVPSDGRGSVRVLSVGLAAAGGAGVSDDGARVVFAGREQNGPQGIWEVPLAGGRPRRLSPNEWTCTAPVFLPDGRVLFSRRAEASQNVWNLFALNTETGATEQVTFGAAMDGPAAVLADGRALYVHRALARAACQHGNAVLMTVRPDGAGQELFYGALDHPVLARRPVETADGGYYFLTGDAQEPALASVMGRRPLGTYAAVKTPAGEVVAAIAEQRGDLLVSVRDSTSGRPWRLLALDPQTGLPRRTLVDDPAWHALEPAVANDNTPRRLTSVVDAKKTVGRILCLNVYDSDLPGLGGETPPRVTTVLVRTATDGRLLGTAPVERDGSFYVEVPADTPISLELRDATGHSLVKTTAALWVRPNESRGCIGCHESRELAPRNRAPLAVRKDPVRLVASPATMPEVSGP